MNEAFEGEGVGFYRCMTCAEVSAPWDLKKHSGCRKCGGVRVKATSLSLIEKIIQIIRRPAVWKWSEDV